MSVREGYKQTEIGVIPEEWEVVELDKVLKYEQPTKYLVESSEYKDEYPIPVLTAGKTFVLGYTNETNGIYQNVPAIIFDDFTTSSKYVDFPFKAKSSAMKILTNRDSRSPLKIFYEYMQNIDFEASTHKRYWISEYSHLKIPLPPLPEQQKITAILTSVDNKIEVIDEQIAKTEALKKGLMQKLLSEGIGHTAFKESEIGKIPEGWEVVKLPDITEKITSGGTPSRKKPEYFENGTIGWLKTGELRDCYIYDSEEKITEDALKNSSAKLFPVDTVLIAMYGATIGQTAYLKKECATNQACCALIFDQSVANPLFYWKYFYFIKENLVSKGIGAGQPNISQGIIKDLPVIYPPLSEQKQIATILSTADDKLDTLREKRSRYEKLKKGLMQKLLTGEVRVKI